MITHKIRIYPNNAMKKFFAEQFEYARLDFNRQLEIAFRGIKAGKIKENNLASSIDAIKKYCLSHADFYESNKYHFPDIILWNAKRVQVIAHQAFRYSWKANPKFKRYEKGKQAFKISSQQFDSHRFQVSENKRLIIDGLGSIKMAENLRFKSFAISCLIQKHNDRYFACFLFPEKAPLYLKSGKSIGLNKGAKSTIVGVDDENKTIKWSINEKGQKQFQKKADHYEKLIHAKLSSYIPGKPLSNRFSKCLQKARTVRFRQGELKSNFIEKTCHDILSMYDVIGIESISSAKFGERKGRRKSDRKIYSAFLNRLVAKGNQIGKFVNQADRQYAANRICSSCGQQNSATKNFKNFQWTCQSCGKKHCIDVNSAINYLNLAKNKLTMLSQSGP